MKLFHRNRLQFLAYVALACLLVGCGNGTNGNGNGNGTGSGTLALGLTDSVNENYQAVYVTIQQVQVHAKGQAQDSEQGWLTVANFQGPQTIDLLKLQDGVVLGLGDIELEAGEYTQVRLVLGAQPDNQPNLLCHPHPFANYVIDGDDNELEMKVPSGQQSGIKIVCAGLCNINENQTTDLILDFDAAESVIVAGNSGNINLKPTIKVLTTEDFTVLTGRVTAQVDGAPLAGAMVSAQIFTAGAVDPIDQVNVLAKTSTDSNGDYRLFLKPENYNVVAYGAGFSPNGSPFNAIAGATSIQDFVLSSSAQGTLSGQVTIPNVDNQTFAHTSFRQTTVLAGQVVEIASRDTANGNSYSVNLSTNPNADYQVVSSTCTEPTLEQNTTVIENANTLLDIIFP